MKRFILFLLIVVLNKYALQAHDYNSGNKNLENSGKMVFIAKVQFSFQDDKDEGKILKSDYTAISGNIAIYFKKTDALEKICDYYKSEIQKLIPAKYQEKWKDLNEKYNLSDFIYLYYGFTNLPHDMTLQDMEKDEIRGVNVDITVSNLHQATSDNFGNNHYETDDNAVPENKREARKAFRDLFRKCFFKTNEEILSELEDKLSKRSAIVSLTNVDQKKSYISFKEFYDNIHNFLSFIDKLNEEEKILYKNKINAILIELPNTLQELLEYCLKFPLVFQGDSSEFTQLNNMHLQKILALRPPIWTFDADKDFVTFAINQLNSEKDKKTRFFHDLIKSFIKSLYDRRNTVQCFRLWNAASDSITGADRFGGEEFIPYIMDHPPENDMSRYAVLIQLLSRGLNEKDNDDSPMPNADYFSRVWGKWEETKGSLDEVLEKNIIQKLISDDRVTEEILRSILDYFYGEKKFNLFIRLWTKLSESNALSDILQQGIMKKMIENPMPSPSYVPLMTFLYDRLDLKSFMAFWNDLNTKKIITATEDDAIEKLLENKAA